MEKGLIPGRCRNSCNESGERLVNCSGACPHARGGSRTCVSPLEKKAIRSLPDRRKSVQSNIIAIGPSWDELNDPLYHFQSETPLANKNRQTSASDVANIDSESAGRQGSILKGSGQHEAIYQAISGAVIEHRLKPGARLREDALAEVFGVSRTGIRKVLQRLALEQLITLTPGKGAAVARPSAEEAREIFEARRLIECALVSRLASRVTPQELSELRTLAHHEQQALQGREQSKAIKVSAAFHSRLAELAGNQTMAQFVAQLCSRSSLILAVYGHAGDLGCDCDDHNHLLDLLAAGDSGAAAAFMEQHLQAVESSLSIDDAGEDAPDLNDVFAMYRS